MRTSRSRRARSAVALLAPWPSCEPLEGRQLFSTYTVTTLGDGAGSIVSGGSDRYYASTLRAALVAANKHAGTDTIQFKAGLTGTVGLGSPLPRVNDSVNVFGPGANKVTVRRSASATFRLLDVAAGKTVKVSGLALKNGAVDPTDPSDANGGGILNAGTLTLTECLLSGNTAYRDGAAVANFGKLTVARCTFDANVASGGNTGSGGGLFNSDAATATLVDCTFSNNYGLDAGAVHNRGSLSATGCTFSGNAGEYAGAIMQSVSAPSSLRLANCTIAGNAAFYSGGAIYVAPIEPGDAPATISLLNCTVVRNDSGGDDTGAPTSRYPALAAGAPVTLVNTIVAGNTSTNAATGAVSAADIGGTIKAAASFNNVIGTGGSGGLANGANGNKVGVAVAALKLGSLTDNGGPTKTVTLGAGSVAINAGLSSAAANAKLFADQRGFQRKSGGTVDVGAYEAQSAGGASVSGTFFDDANRSGSRQTGEPGLGGWQAYVDANRNGVYDAGERSAYSNSSGYYKFTGLAAGTYRIYEVRKDGWVRTKPSGAYPSGYYDVTVSGTQAVTGKDYGNYLG
ncbi:MAG TPA: choice-of-anchor Q domain-containing protein [Humisphaera sp.]